LSSYQVNLTTFNYNSQDSKVIFHEVRFKCNSSLVQNFSFVAFNDSNGDSRLNWTMMLPADYQKVTIAYRLAIPDMNTQFFDAKIQGNIDTCKASKGVIGSFFTKMMHKGLAKYSNYRFVCPVTKGIYFAHNFMVDDSFLPPNLLGLQFKFVLYSSTKAKLAKGKTFVEGFSMQITGIVI